jgi:hypothetical protein
MTATAEKAARPLTGAEVLGPNFETVKIAPRPPVVVIRLPGDPPRRVQIDLSRPWAETYLAWTLCAVGYPPSRKHSRLLCGPG